MSKLDDRALEAAARAIAVQWALGDKDLATFTPHALARAAVTAYLAEAGDGWMPIETAPHSQMLLIANSGWGYVDRQIACRRDYAESGWVDQFAQPIHVAAKPTHWRPLPAPPAAQDPRP